MLYRLLSRTALSSLMRSTRLSLKLGIDMVSINVYPNLFES